MKNSRLHTQHDQRILICLVISSFSPLHTGMVGRFTCSAQPEAVIAIFMGTKRDTRNEMQVEKNDQDIYLDKGEDDF